MIKHVGYVIKHCYLHVEDLSHRNLTTLHIVNLASREKRLGASCNFIIYVASLSIGCFNRHIISPARIHSADVISHIKFCNFSFIISSVEAALHFLPFNTSILYTTNITSATNFLYRGGKIDCSIEFWQYTVLTLWKYLVRHDLFGWQSWPDFLIST